MRNAISILIVLLLIAVGAYLFLSKEARELTGPEVNPSIVTSGENPEPGSTVHDLPVEPAAAAARKDLAANLSIEEKSIVILKVEEATWNDGCLGLGGPAEICLQALVPGFKVELLAKGKTYFYRTDKTGSIVRFEVR